jgi:hypothetical protein
MTSAVTLNPFDLLGDTDGEDPAQISASIRKPASVTPAAPTPEVKAKKPVPQGISFII